LVFAALVLAGCAGGSSAESGASGASSAATPALENCPVSYDENFGQINIDTSIDDFNALGFAYGDEVSIAFSNGYQITVPYFSGYYGKVGDRMLVAYPGYEYVLLAESFGNSMWETAGLADGDTATVTLAGAGTYADAQESFNITYSDERSDFASDAAFANFRSIAGGSIAPNTVYRSASPVDDEHNRSGYVNKLMADAGVRFVLNLSDDDAEMDEDQADAKEKGVDQSPFVALRESGNVLGLNLGANYPSASYAQKLAAGLVELSKHDGPYLVHCVEGKDRTGFTCMLLEALAGATYDEMLADYMITYDKYYGITEQSDPTRYNVIARTTFDGMLEHLPGMEGADLATASYAEPARAYLRMGGMTDEQIDALVARITA